MNEFSLKDGDLYLEVFRKLQRLAEVPGRIESVLSQIESGNININSSYSAKSRHTLHRIEHAQQRAGLAITAAGLLIAGVQLLNHGQAHELAWGFILGADFEKGTAWAKIAL